MTAMAGSTELRWGGTSDTGRVRPNNEDSFLVHGEAGLWAVADGMGGHRGGDVASQTACQVLGRSFNSRTVDGLVDAVRQANAAVYEVSAGDPELAGMGTTLVALALVDDRGEQVLAIASVGDSRVYRLPGDDLGLDLDQLTEDHSLVADLVREGSLSPEEAAMHPQRNIVTRVLGVDSDVDVDMVTVLPQHGDRYVLCSDGLFNEVPERTIAAVLRRVSDPGEVAHELVHLANEGGGRDNVTVVVVDVVDDAGQAEAASAALAGEPGTATSTAAHDLGPPTERDVEGGRRGRGGGRRSSRRHEGGPRHRARKPRRITWRVVVFVVLLLGLAGGAVATIQWYGRSTYFVGFNDDDRVAIFRGRPGGVLWVQPELVEAIELQRDDVPDDRVAQLNDGQEHGSLADARASTERLKERADRLAAARASDQTSTTTTSRPTTTTSAQPSP